MKIAIIKVTNPLPLSDVFSFVKTQTCFVPYLLQEGALWTVVRKLKSRENRRGLCVKFVDHSKLIATTDQGKN